MLFSVYSCRVVTVFLHSIFGLLQFFLRLLKRFLKACGVRLEYPEQVQSIKLQLFWLRISYGLLVVSDPVS